MTLTVKFIIAAQLALHQPRLKQQLEEVSQELQTEGYKLEGSIHVEELGKGVESQLGGTWQAGRMALRLNPEGSISFEQHLRHELQHEANWQTCGGRAPLWAKEAAAMNFSGETVGRARPLEIAERRELKASVQAGPLTHAALEGLRSLLDQVGWAKKPCEIYPPLLSRILEEAASASMPGGGWLLMNLASGRIYEQDLPDASVQLPIGSLLKIPFAAALERGGDAKLASYLARSDTRALIPMRRELDSQLLQRWLEPLFQPVSPGQRLRIQDIDTRVLLGESASDHQQVFKGSQLEIARLLRLAILNDPGRFANLPPLQHMGGSTLGGWAPQSYPVLRALDAWAKTGTVSTAKGQPEWGWIMVVWPTKDPVFMLLMREPGRHGRDLWPKVSPLLRQWKDSYRAAQHKVRVQLFTALQPNAWSVLSSCENFTSRQSSFSRCGDMRFATTARNTDSVREVKGIIEIQNGRPILTTDLLSYTEGSLTQEGAGLPEAARNGLATILAWNAQQAVYRHPQFKGLCDTTHCAVFKGVARVALNSKKLSQELMGLGEWLPKALSLTADEPHARAHALWLHFSKGDEAPWQRDLSGVTIQSRGGPEGLLRISRRRERSGSISLVLDGVEDRFTWSCLFAMSRLKLPSCPETVIWEKNHWRFQGRGETHGLGLSLSAAAKQAAEGWSEMQILKAAYRDDKSKLRL